jgi:Uncharacterized conserved protein
MDVLGFAIRMEAEGEAYYREQAGRFAGSGLQKVFLMLAEDEKRHAVILESLEKGGAYTLADSKTLGMARSIFSALGDFKSEIQKIPNQLDAYEMALDMEKKSIDLYEEQLAKAEDSQKEIFAYLAEQERDHYNVMDDLMQAVRNAVTWVESAEFGIRKEY